MQDLTGILLLGSYSREGEGGSRERIRGGEWRDNRGDSMWLKGEGGYMGITRGCRIS